MRLAHVRERHAPRGRPWRLAAALDSTGGHWLDLEPARRRAAAADPRLAHNALLYRQPLTTLDELLERGLRVEALRELVDGSSSGRSGAIAGPEDVGSEDAGDEAVLEAADLDFGPPILRPPSLRDFYAFEGHVATTWSRRQQPIPEAWYRLPIFYFSNVSEIRGPEEPVCRPRGSKELDYELEVAALVDTPARDLPPDRGEEAIGGYLIFNDWSARDLQREETAVRLGPAKGKDFGSSIGPWLVTPDELADARAGKGYELAMSATVNGRELSRGTWRDVAFSYGEMVARASADARLRPGDLLGSGTVGTGCLLEIGEERLGRYLEPGDEVVLRVERLGELRTPVVERPEA
jgi:fumarylacetoacetate (FAA) hydrolase